MASFLLQQQRGVVVKEITKPIKIKIFTIPSHPEKVIQPKIYSQDRVMAEVLNKRLTLFMKYFSGLYPGDKLTDNLSGCTGGRTGSNCHLLHTHYLSLTMGHEPHMFFTFTESQFVISLEFHWDKIGLSWQ